MQYSLNYILQIDNAVELTPLKQLQTQLNMITFIKVEFTAGVLDWTKSVLAKCS